MPSSNTEWERKVPPVGHAERFYHRRNTKQLPNSSYRRSANAAARRRGGGKEDGSAGSRATLLSPSETHGWPQAAGLPSVL